VERKEKAGASFSPMSRKSLWAGTAGRKLQREGGKKGEHVLISFSHQRGGDHLLSSPRKKRDQ